MDDQDQLKEALHGVGASKIIYSLVMPETEAVKRKVLRGDIDAELDRMFNASGGLPIDKEAILKAMNRADASYYDKFHEAWTQKQDSMHQEFFDRWFEWVQPITAITKQDFSYQYPTAGASQGLEAVINEYGARSRRGNFNPEIHLFNGEYEGFDYTATTAAIQTVKHDRNHWHEAIDKIAKASQDKPVQIYLSQPSAIDGNVWSDYDAFMQELAAKAPKAEVILDLTYVGCISKEAHIRTDYPNIPAIVFSLSKPIGGYYDRIGGVVAKARDGQEPYPSLFGNKWFKNLTSLAIGTEFMKEHGVYDMPRKYAPIQQAAINEITKNLKAKHCDVTLKPADVFLLATGDVPEHPQEIHRYLQRPADGHDILRLCLTPTMSEMIGMAKTNEVSPRYYERGSNNEGATR